VTVTRIAGDRAHLAALAPFMMNATTKCEFVQNTLFVL